MLVPLIFLLVFFIIWLGLFIYEKNIPSYDGKPIHKNSTFVLVIFAVIQFFIFKEQEYVFYLKPGIQYAPHEPIQKMLSGDVRKRFATELDPNIEVELLAEYDITGLVLDTTRHFKGMVGADSYLFMDIGMGWGKMSDPFYAQHPKIEFSNRFYYLSYRFWEGYPLKYEEWDDLISNTHILPKDAKIRRKLKQARNGRVVRLKGYLVNIYKNGYKSRESSLVRTDDGNGACEAMYVTDVEIIERGWLPKL